MKETPNFWALAWVIAVLVTEGWALPAGLNVYFGSHYDATERTLYRDGITPLPGSSVLQPVRTVDGVNDGVWTNPAANYLYGDDVLYTLEQAATTMGSDPLGGGYPDGSGEWNTVVAGGDTALGGNVYYVRIFSSSTITGAAYYADTKNLVGTFPNTDYGDFTDMYVNVVNPAYVIPFDMAPVAAPAYVVTGSVYATAAGGNNQLESGWVLVEWRYANEMLWREGDNDLDAEGNFWFVPGLVSDAVIYVRARVKDGYTPRSWFPQSEQYLLNVAYSAPPFIDITNEPMVMVAGASSAVIGGTNVNVTSPMWWSNTLAVGEWEINFSDGSFSATINNLQVGENTIYVYGTNVFGWWTNDSVTLTVPMPVPFIDITNEPMILPPGTDSVTLGGTNVNVTSPMWWSNTLVMGGGAIYHSGGNFSFVANGLTTGVNVIYVYGTNILGHWTNDSVAVTVASPNRPAVGWVITNVLGSIGQLRDGSGVISNAFRIEDEDADICAVMGVGYSLNGLTWQVIPSWELSGALSALASANILISAPTHVMYWNARSAFGASVVSGWLRIRVQDAGLLESDWAVGAFVYDGVCQNFAITAPHGGSNFITNSGASAVWTVSGTIEVNAKRVSVHNTLTGSTAEDTSAGPTWDVQMVMGNGTNMLIAVGEDYYGNVAWATQTIVIADARWPVVDIIDPAGEEVAVAASQSYYDIRSTNANVTALRVIINGHATSYMPVQNPFNFTVALAEGTNIITVEGTNALASTHDTVRIIRPTMVTLPGAPFVDIIDPAVTVTSVAGQQSTYFIRSTNANVVAIGTVLNGVVALYSPAVNPYNFEVALGEGINTITVIGTNAAGVVAQESVTIIRLAVPIIEGAPHVDIIDPAVTVTHVPPAQTVYYVRSTNAYVVGLAVQINAGPEISVPLANPYDFMVALAEGINTITVNGTNAAGVRAVDSVTIVRMPGGPVDHDAPFIDIIDPTGTIAYVTATQTTYFVQSTNANVVAVGTLLNGVITLFPAVNPYNFEIALGEGVNTITVVGTNAAGVMATDSVTILRPRSDIISGEPYVEIVDPATLITHVPAHQSDYTVVSTNANVVAIGFETNGVRHMQGAENPYSVVMKLALGVNTITIMGTNAAGQEARDSATIVRGGGGIPPWIVSVVPPSGYVSSTNWVWMTITVGDDLGQVVVEVNGVGANGNYPVFTHQFALGAEGEWRVAQIVARDNEGFAVTQDVMYTWSVGRNVAPLIYILLPGTDGEVMPTNYIPVFGAAEDPDGSVMRVELNGVAVNEPYYPWYVPNHGPLQVGGNILRAIAIDDRGATGTAQRVVYYEGPQAADNVPPVVRIVQPTNWFVAVHSPIVVSGWATDNYAVTEVEVNGIRVVPPAYPEAWERTVALELGTNMIVARAVDAAGNAGYATAMVVYVPGIDTNPPVVWISSHYNYQVVDDAVQVISGGSYDPEPGSGVARIFVNGVEAVGVAPYVRPLTLAYGSNVVRAVAVDGAGNTSAPAEVVIYYLTNGPAARVTISEPSVGVTNVSQVAFNGWYGINEIPVGGVLTARVNGSVVWAGMTLNGPITAPWNAGVVTLVRGRNLLEVELTLATGFRVVATHEIWHELGEEWPEILIVHPRANTSTVDQVMFFGNYRLSATTNATIYAWVNEIPVLIQTTPPGPVFELWDAGVVNLRLGENVLSARIVAADGKAADDAVRMVVCTSCVCTARPWVTIEEPTYGATNVQRVAFRGSYDLDGGVMTSFKAYVNGIEVPARIYTTNGWDAGSVELALGLNRLDVILQTWCGVAATARVEVVYTLVDPFIQITFPTLEPVWMSESLSMHIGGVYFCATSLPVRVWWRNSVNGAEGETIWSNGFWNAHHVPLEPCTNNLFVVTLRNHFGHEVSDTLLITVPCSNDTLEVICNWPRYLGIGQTGLVEFLSPEAGVPYQLYWGGTNGVVIGSGIVGSSELVGTRYYHVARYWIDDVRLVLNGRGTSNDIWLVLAGATARVARLPRMTYVVPDMVVSEKGKVNMDIDGDQFVVTFKGAPQSLRQVIGRTIVVSNVTAKDSLAVKVSQNPNGGDGAVVLAMLVIESGNMKGLKWVGDVDDVIVTGSLQRVVITAGNLGYSYDTRSRYYHGYVASKMEGGAQGAKQVITKARKTTVNGQTVMLGGNIEGDVRLDQSYQRKGVTLAAGNGSVHANIVVDAIKGLVAKGRVPVGVISNTHVIARGEIEGKVISVGKMQSRSLADTTIAGARDIKSVAAVEITDSTRDLQDNVTNHPRRAMQIIAGWWYGVLDAPFRPWLVASNGYEGVIVSGVVQRVSAKTVHEGVQVTAFGEKGVKKPSSKVVQTNAVWWVDGKLAPPNWDGKTRP